MILTPYILRPYRFDQWAAYKPKTKFGQVPILQIGDGEELYQSSAQLKYVALAAPASGLYPADDPAKCVLIDEMIGLCGDFQQAWTPCVYANMRPQAYGYDADMPADEKAALVQKLRANFLAETLPRFAGYFAKALDDGKKKFLCGATPTIADCYALPMFRYYTKGIADGIPSDCLKPYPVITAYIDRMMALEPIAKWYADK